MTAQLTAVSLFAGVGGFDIALGRAGVRVVATCEIDDKARGVLAHRFPNTAHFQDIKELSGEQLINSGFDPDNGIIVGGFPYQDLSVAGRRAGLAGARSGLFWEICRLLDETKARYFILENVPGLLSSNEGRDLGTVVGALVERGYGVAYRILDAQHFGVPQRRRRIFIVGSLGGHWRTPSEILALVEGRGRHLAESYAKRKATSRGATEGAGSGGITAFAKSRRAKAVDDFETWVESGVSPTLNLMDNTGDARATVVAIQNTVIGRSDNAGPQGKGYADDGEPMFTIDTTSPHAIAVTPIQDAREVEKHQNGLGIGEEGDPAYTVDTVSRQAVSMTPTIFEATRVDDARFYEDYSPTVASYWGTGGARVPYVVREEDPVVMREREGKAGGGKGPMLSDKSFTIKGANDQAIFQANGVNSLTPWPEMGEAMRVYGDDGVAPIVKQHQMNVLQACTVRRLTPTECERLQGFPDGWTAEYFDFKKNEVRSAADSSRYKQMGNAVAIPVVEWIAKRLVWIHENEAQA